MTESKDTGDLEGKKGFRLFISEYPPGVTTPEELAAYFRQHVDEATWRALLYLARQAESKKRENAKRPPESDSERKQREIDELRRRLRELEGDE